MNMKTQDYTELIARVLANEATPEEKEQFQEWLHSSRENEQTFQEYRRIWDNLVPFEPEHKPDVQSMWAEIEAQLDGNGAYSGQRPGSARRYVPFWQRQSVWVAATLLAAAVVLLFFYQWLRVSPQEIYRTGAGEKQQLILPDQSLVYLNAESEIRYPKHFSDTLRTVFLKGEAFFRVQKSSVPFEVRTENAAVRVLGTEFDVWARRNITRVVVREGRVRIASRQMATMHPIILQANQMSTVAANQPPTPPETVDADFLIGWLKNRFVFYKTPLSEIVGELERRYNIQIELGSPDLAQRTITGAVEEGSVDSTLKYLCMTLNVSYRFDGEKYIIEK